MRPADDPQQVERYAIEWELAERLRRAPDAVRRELYAEVYTERSRRMPDHPLVRQARDPRLQQLAVSPQVRLLRRFVAREHTFVEVGAGDAAVAKAVAPLVARSLAFDVSEELVTAEAPPNFEFRRFDGFHFGLEPASVDVAYSHDVLEHLHPNDAVVQTRAVAAALRPGGRYICVTPNRLTGPHDISRHFSSTPLGFHLREYTVRELQEHFREAGFRRVHVFASYYGRVLTPQLDASFARPVEWFVARLPLSARQHLTPFVAALKVLATR